MAESIPELNSKRVSFSQPKTPAVGVGHADQDMAIIQAGCKLFKVRGRRKYLRLFSYDRDLNCIAWESAHKKTTKSRIYLSNIHEIRTGKSTESFRNSKVGLEFSDGQSFSIIYGPNYEILDLASTEVRIINAWTTLLQSLIGGRSVEYQPIRDRWLKEQFELADKDMSGTLEEKECSELLHALNLNISKKQIGIQFKQFDANANGKLDFDEFKQFFESLSTRDEIVKIFNESIYYKLLTYFTKYLKQYRY
ncbi:hypothetical protein LOD99_12384 [Oopsacas minuta]|uniref:EF-hand domain-containing protein n=1 Tax=Oopsacas minuta TaxID=111878 RepID=A0AAV7JF55_9METZ|nr:hypothetical protein LOD99_12384 [Oopsacas minuta]